MDEEHCPECGNEIYKPFTYCNACGWEKKEVEEKGKKEKGKKPPKKESEKGLEKPKKPLKITCKCGKVIKVKSTKRPLKIKCPNCGKTGTLKAPPKPEAAPAPSKPSKGEIDKKGKKGKKDKIEKDIKDVREDKKALRKKEKLKLRKKGKDRDLCPKCGTRLGMTGNCPRCGYRVKASTKKRRHEDRRREEATHKRKPPKGARGKKPVKGVCSSCGSRNLRFFDDGSGRCPNCGREFRWDGGTSRLEKEEYFCDRCDEPLEYIEEYDSWYCNKCKAYQ